MAYRTIKIFADSPAPIELDLIEVQGQSKEELEKKILGTGTKQLVLEKWSNPKNKDTWLRPYVSPDTLDKLETAIKKINPKFDMPNEIMTDAKQASETLGYTGSGKSLEFALRAFYAGYYGNTFSYLDNKGVAQLQKIYDQPIYNIKPNKRGAVNLVDKLGVSSKLLTGWKKVSDIISEVQTGKKLDKGTASVDKDYEQLPTFDDFWKHPLIKEWRDEYLLDREGKALQDQQPRVKKLWIISLFSKPKVLQKLLAGHDRMVEIQEGKDKGEYKKLELTPEQKKEELAFHDGKPLTATERKRLEAELGLNPYELSYRDAKGKHLDLDEKEKKLDAEKVAKRAFDGYVKFMHMAHPIRDKHGELTYSGQKKSGSISGHGWYFYGKAFRRFLEDMSQIRFKKGETGMFQQSTSELAGLYSHVKTDEIQTMEIQKCIKKISENLKTKLYGKLKVHSGLDGLYLAFRIILECGFRKTEIFTIASDVPTAREGRDADSGTELVDGVYHLTCYTRKTKWVKKFVSTASVLDKEVTAMITKRLAEIQKGKDKKKYSDKEALELFGVDRSSEKHSLIGWDNEFTKVDSLASPKVRFNSTNLTIFYDALKQCYREVQTKNSEGMMMPLPDLDFFIEHPMHVLRHVFAHKWLRLTKYNYGVVAEWGHWHTIAELERSYGKMPRKFAEEQMTKYLQDAGQKVTEKEVSDAMTFDSDQNEPAPVEVDTK